MTPKKSKTPSVNTGGGAYIGGKVDTGGGDFVGRDQTVTNYTSTQNVFAPIYHAIEQSARPVQEKEDLKAEMQEIEAAVAKSEPVDEPWLSRKLRALKRMAPDIAEVALAALSGPGAAVAAIVKNVAKKVQAEASA
jgi:hypothetical protein